MDGLEVVSKASQLRRTKEMFSFSLAPHRNRCRDALLGRGAGQIGKDFVSMTADTKKSPHSPMAGCCFTCKIRVCVSASFTDMMTSRAHTKNSTKDTVMRYFSSRLRRCHSDVNEFCR
jgi:hypothetical protein